MVAVQRRANMKRIERTGPVQRCKCGYVCIRRVLFFVMAFVLPLLLPSTAAAQTGGISGTVTDAGTGVGLSSTSVSIYSWNGPFVTSAATTAGTGAYSVAGLPAGIYFARTNAPSNYVDKAYVSVPCENCAITTTQPIYVAAGATTSNINFAL